MFLSVYFFSTQKHFAAAPIVLDGGNWEDSLEKIVSEWANNSMEQTSASRKSYTARSMHFAELTACFFWFYKNVLFLLQ